MTTEDTATQVIEPEPVEPVELAAAGESVEDADTVEPQPTRATRARSTRSPRSTRKKTPRKKTTSTPAGSTDSTPRAAGRRKRSLKKPIEEMLNTTAGLVSLANATDGAIISAGAPRLAVELDKLAERNDFIYKWLSGMASGAGNLSLLMAISAIVIPILANHEKLPPEVAALFVMVNVADDQLAAA